MTKILNVILKNLKVSGFTRTHSRLPSLKYILSYLKQGPQFTEDEEAIVQYLKEDEPLPPEVLDKIVPAWWNEEPFK